MLYFTLNDKIDMIKYPGDFFDAYYEQKWLEDPFVEEIIKSIDKSTVFQGKVIDSPVLGIISPKELSSGCKTLILLYKCPDHVYNASYCGDNCGSWMLQIGELQDIRVYADHMLLFRDLKDMDEPDLNIICMDDNKVFNTLRDYGFYFFAKQEEYIENESV